jgi:hypothetical protein
MVSQEERLRQRAHAIVEARLRRLRLAQWTSGIIGVLATGALAAEAIVPESRMTGDQQFYLAMAAMAVNTVFLILTYMKANATHGLVNSELTEFKRLLQENAIRAQTAAHAEGISEGTFRAKQHADPPIWKPPTQKDSDKALAAEPKKKDKL